jgi:large subunit ribosomal protein L35
MLHLFSTLLNASKMERVHQMNVVPDLLSELHPSFDLRVNFPEQLLERLRRLNRTRRKYEMVEAGVFLLPEQVRLLLVKCSITDS